MEFIVLDDRQSEIWMGSRGLHRQFNPMCHCHFQASVKLTQRPMQPSETYDEGGVITDFRNVVTIQPG